MDRLRRWVDRRSDNARVTYLELIDTAAEYAQLHTNYHGATALPESLFCEPALKQQLQTDHTRPSSQFRACVAFVVRPLKWRRRQTSSPHSRFCVSPRQWDRLEHLFPPWNLMTSCAVSVQNLLKSWSRRTPCLWVVLSQVKQKMAKISFAPLVLQKLTCFASARNITPLSLSGKIPVCAHDCVIYYFCQ